MCRLFGMSAAPHRVHATFWLLEAPDSLLAQSHRDPDGTGLGYFAPDGTPHVDKQPIAAFADRAFALEGREADSRTFVAHVRFATSGGLTPDNTHPFQLQNRLLAHNGVIGDLAKLEAELGSYAGLVRGETDSERFFALVTKQIDAHDGDVSAGLTAAARWVGRELSLYSLNVILITDRELWALRYPENEGLFVLERTAGGPHGAAALEHSSPRRTIHVHSDDLAGHPAVVIASEPMDDDPAWRLLAGGELLHVDSNLAVSSTVAVEHPPSHPLTLADVAPAAGGPRAAPAA